MPNSCQVRGPITLPLCKHPLGPHQIPKKKKKPTESIIDRNLASGDTVNLLRYFVRPFQFNPYVLQVLSCIIGKIMVLSFKNVALGMDSCLVCLQSYLSALILASSLIAVVLWREKPQQDFSLSLA